MKTIKSIKLMTKNFKWLFIICMCFCLNVVYTINSEARLCNVGAERLYSQYINYAQRSPMNIGELQNASDDSGNEMYQFKFTTINKSKEIADGIVMFFVDGDGYVKSVGTGIEANKFSNGGVAHYFYISANILGLTYKENLQLWNMLKYTQEPDKTYGDSSIYCQRAGKTINMRVIALNNGRMFVFWK